MSRHPTIQYFTRARAIDGGGQPVRRHFTHRQSKVKDTEPLGVCDLYHDDGGRPAWADPDEDLFQWGYSGAGPTLLASSILADALGPGAVDRRMIVAFRDEIVAGLPRSEGWHITIGDVRCWHRNTSGAISQVTGGEKSTSDAPEPGQAPPIGS